MGLVFERRLWRMQRENQAAAVRKCESEQPKHERPTAKGQPLAAGKGNTISTELNHEWLTAKGVL